MSIDRTKIFFDCEFTGLQQNTTLISIWIISECWEEFYAEFTDYNLMQCNEWIVDNVLNNLILKESYSKSNRYKWDSKFIKEKLIKWLWQFAWVEVWSDCLSYDWVLFNTLLADYSNWYPELPCWINYIPFDICTLFKIKWIDPDISREEFVKEEIWNKTIKKHNALFDAKVIKYCYDKLI